MNGLGAYPTNQDGTANGCFDPNRPFFYPYWWDTLEESTCKWGLGANTNPGAGGISASTSGWDATLTSISQIVILLGLASMALNLYVGGRR